MLANELRGRNITVNAVAPGPTGTELFLNGKGEATNQGASQSGPAGATRNAGRYRWRCVVPRRTRRWMGQRAGGACKRRFRLDLLPQIARLREYKEVAMRKIIVITGASSGFGALTARALAKAGHCVYAACATLPGTKCAASGSSCEIRKGERGRPSHAGTRCRFAGVGRRRQCEKMVSEHKRLDVVIHNAGHMVFGPAEAFTPEQLAELYDVNVLSTQRVNRAALPQLRKQRHGLVVWVSSSSAAGGTPPYLGTLFCCQGRHGCFGRRVRT